MNEPQPLPPTPSQSFGEAGQPPDPESTRRPPIPVVTVSLDPASTDAAQRYGRFVVRHIHAKGGLGEVHVAVDEELKRDVALKRMQERCARNPIARRRFLNEAEITARLEHPGIVPIYGLVQDDRGEPCYAMRFIEGESLAQAIKRFHGSEGILKDERRSLSPPSAGADKPRRSFDFNSLAFRQLLQRFVSVCQTMAYAHSKYVIHRDLKPANVMLGPFGETLVVDWGLAREIRAAAPIVGAMETPHEDVPATVNLAPSGSEDMLYTQDGEALGTPGYMAPEQALGRWNAVGPRSDIFSLGATLCELLTGQRPVRGRNAREALQLAQAGEFPSPRTIKPDVPKPLEAICLRAMARNPDLRYATAKELAADVENWLADEPVSAFADRLAARLRRWGRRHLALVAGGAALLLTASVGLAIGLAAVEGERRQTELERQATVRERDQKALALEAQVVARKSERLARELTLVTLRDMKNDLVENQLASATYLTDENKEFLRKIIKHYECFAAITEADPVSREIRAEGYGSVGLMRHRLGEMQDAEADLTKAEELCKQLVAEFPKNAAYRQNLARSQANLGHLLLDTGRLKEAESVCLEAKGLFEQLATELPKRADILQELAITLTMLGQAYSASGKTVDAELAFTDALSVRERLAGEHRDRPEFRDQLSGSYNNLAVLYFGRGRHQQAEEAYAKALAVEKLLANNYPKRPEFQKGLAMGQTNLANLFRDIGRPKEAEDSYVAALALQKQLVADFPASPDYRLSLSNTHKNMGVFFSQTGRIKEAEAAYATASAIQKQLADDYPMRPEFRQHLALTHGNWANLFTITGRSQEAEASYLDALSIQKKLTGDFPTHPEFRRELADTHDEIGNLFRDTGRLPDAEAAYAAAMALQKELVASFPSNHEFRQNLAVSYANMGRLRYITGRLIEAESAFVDALAIQKQLASEFPAIPGFRQGLAISYNNVGNVHSALKQMDEAEKAHTTALSLRKQLVAEFPTHTNYRMELASSYNNLAPLLAHSRRIKEAEEAYAAALDLRKQLAAESPTRVDIRQELAASHNNLGSFLNDTGRAEAAETAYVAAQALFQQLATEFPKSPDYQNAVAGTFVNLALICKGRRDFAGAKSRLESAVRFHEAALHANPRHPTYRQFYRNNIWTMIQIGAGLGDRQAALDAAAKRRDMGWFPPMDAYDAAGGLAQCVPLIEKDESATEEKRRQEAQYYADQAMSMLQAAVAKGWTNINRIKQDKELDPLRQREDFQKLLAELEGKQ